MALLFFSADQPFFTILIGFLFIRLYYFKSLFDPEINFNVICLTIIFNAVVFFSPGLLRDKDQKAVLLHGVCFVRMPFHYGRVVYGLPTWCFYLGSETSCQTLCNNLWKVPGTNRRPNNNRSFLL